MDTERRVIAELLALKDAPDDALLGQVEAIGVTTARSVLYDEAAEAYRPAGGNGLHRPDEPYQRSDPAGVIGMARLLVQDPPEQLVEERSRPRTAGRLRFSDQLLPSGITQSDGPFPWGPR